VNARVFPTDVICAHKMSSTAMDSRVREEGGTVVGEDGGVAPAGSINVDVGGNGRVRNGEIVL